MQGPNTAHGGMLATGWTTNKGWLRWFSNVAVVCLRPVLRERPFGSSSTTPVMADELPSTLLGSVAASALLLTLECPTASLDEPRFMAEPGPWTL